MEKTYQQMIIERIKETEDLVLLDLIYKILTNK